MNMQRGLIALTAAVCSLQMIAPVSAQTVMLSGSGAPVSNGGYRIATPIYDQQVVRPVVVQQPVYVPRAQTYVRPRTQVRTVYVRDQRTFFQRHPMIKGATIGAGVGAAAGAITGAITRRGIMRGALIGAGTGAGIGVVRTSRTMRRHPIIRDVATGALAGMGIGWAGSRRGGTVGKAAGIGALAGLGWGLFRHLR